MDGSVHAWMMMAGLHDFFLAGISWHYGSPFAHPPFSTISVIQWVGGPSNTFPDYDFSHNPKKVEPNLSQNGWGVPRCLHD